MIGYDYGRRKAKGRSASYWILGTMFLVLVCFVILFSPHGCQGADRYTKADYLREGAYLAAHTVDYLQTLKIASHPESYHERNPILGPHPSKEEVTVYFASSAVLHLALSWLLPPPYREAFQYTTIIFKTGLIGVNFNIGLGP